MSKTKSTTKASKATDKTLSKVKDAAIAKPSQSPKAKSKEIARQVKAKEEKASRKQKKKEPTPSSSESESDSDEEMDQASSSSDSESESEAETKPVKKTKAAESSESESEESDSSASEDEAPAKAKVETKTEAVKEPTSESEEEDEEEPGSDKDSSESDSDSDSEEESDKSKEVTKEAPKKRKAEEEAVPASKKSKTEEADNSPNLFVGNLSWNVDEEWLRREFEDFGELSGVRIMTERESGRSRGFGYVEYISAADAKKAHEAKSGAEIDGRTINLDYAKPRDAGNQAPGDKAQSRARSFGDQTSPESDTLFIGNISFSVNEDNVREHFSEQGSVLGIRLPTDQESGRPKGFGYIQFSSNEEAKEALNALQGTELGGRPLRLDFSTPRPAGDGNRGGRGGRGGGRGGNFGGRGGRGDRGGRGGFGGRGGRGGTGANSTNRGGFGDFSGRKTTF